MTGSLYEASDKFKTMLNSVSEDNPEGTSLEAEPASESPAPSEKEDVLALEVKPEGEIAAPAEPEETPAAVEAEAPPDDFISTMDELAESYDFSVEDIQDLTVRTKIDGVEGSVPFKELLKNYQTGNSADRRMMEVAEQRKQLDAEVAEQSRLLQAEWQRSQAVSAELDSLLNSDTDAELADLRHTDPGEYSARMQERESKRRRAEGVRANMQAEASKKQQELYSFTVQRESRALRSAIPEWEDEKVMERESNEIHTYLKGQGLQDHEIQGQVDNNGNILHSGITDHRAWLMARKAMLYDKAKQGFEPKRKRLKAVPKVGAGRPKGKQDKMDDVSREGRKRLRTTGKLKDAASVFKGMMDQE